MNELYDVEELTCVAEAELEQFEILVARAWLESVDGPISPDDDRIFNNDNLNHSNDDGDLQKNIFQQYPELRKDIGLFSARLDKLAATIDSIKSHSDDDVKSRKKQLSNKVVGLMNELDRMIASLNLAVS